MTTIVMTTIVVTTIVVTTIVVTANRRKRKRGTLTVSSSNQFMLRSVGWNFGTTGNCPITYMYMYMRSVVGSNPTRGNSFFL